MKIQRDPLTGSAIKVFLQQHLDDMYATSPAESVHALDITDLQQTDVLFFSGTHNSELVCCGAIKTLSDKDCEVKSMRTAVNQRGKGFAKIMLAHLLEQAKYLGFKRIYLETGSMGFFKPARTLYETFGFAYTSPFGGYKEDPNSVFMVKYL